jgi:DNA-binding NarL/FixJ family response regulator
VVSFPLSASAAESLRRSIGATIELVDIRDADGSEDLVVVSSVSRQLLGKLRTAFPDATLYVIEVEDEAHRLDLAGPVIRALDAGAHGYLVARSVDELAEAIARAARAGEQTVASEPIALAAPVDDDLDGILDAIICHRQRAREPRVD